MELVIPITVGICLGLVLAQKSLILGVAIIGLTLLSPFVANRIIEKWLK